MWKFVGSAVLSTLLVAGAAEAEDITFSGNLTGVCTLAVPTSGTLGLTAQGALSTSAGLPAVLSILSVGSNTLTINPPVWSDKPAGYVAGTESLKVGYTGLAGLGLANQALTASTTTRTISTLPLSLLTVNAEATNSNGFPAGHYEMKVTFTCS